MNESSGDFQQGGYLYKPSSGSNGHPSTCKCLTGLRESRPVNFWQWCSLLIELSVSDEKVLCHCVSMWGFLQILSHILGVNFFMDLWI